MVVSQIDKVFHLYIVYIYIYIYIVYYVNIWKVDRHLNGSDTYRMCRCVHMQPTKRMSDLNHALKQIWTPGQFHWINETIHFLICHVCSKITSTGFIMQYNAIHTVTYAFSVLGQNVTWELWLSKTVMNPASRIPLEISCWFLDDDSTVDNQCSEWSELCGSRASKTLTVSYGETSSHRMMSINLRQMEEIPGDGKHLASVNPQNGVSGFHLWGAWRPVWTKEFD